MYFKEDCRKHLVFCSTQGYVTLHSIQCGLTPLPGLFQRSVFWSFQLKIHPLVHLNILNPTSLLYFLPSIYHHLINLIFCLFILLTVCLPR